MMSSGRPAFALSIVLWIVAVLLLGIAYIGTLSRESLTESFLLKDKLSSQIKAENYLEILKYYISTAKSDGEKLMNSLKGTNLPSEIVLDGRMYQVDKNITISLRDASSMVHPLDISMYVTGNQEREERLTIHDSILDWLDDDNMVRLNGAESAYYMLQKSLGYQPANIGLFQSVDEFRLIKGLREIEQDRWEALKQNISYQFGIINLLLIDAHYLSSILSLDLSEARSLIVLREKDREKFRRIVEKNKRFDENAMGFWISYKIHIEIIVKQNRATTKLYATYIKKATQENFFFIDDYKVY